VPVVIRTEHLPFVSDDPGHRAQYVRAMHHVDQLVCVSNQARDSFVDAGMSTRGRIAVIRNAAPVIARTSDRTAVRSTLGFEPDSRIVLTVARYTEQKDHRTLLDAIPIIINSEPRARFVWVGTGPLKGPMIDAVRRQDLGRYVMFLGQRDDVPELMAAADVFALASRFEGLPLAILEAMAAGLPVVATRVCGTAEAVRHGLTGLLVEPGRPAALATALVDVLTKPEWAARLGERGRIRARRCFSVDRMARRTLALYDDVLSRTRAAISARHRVNDHVPKSPGVAL
jgi:glycosyltransferase involved in cell wall biosynthesis